MRRKKQLFNRLLASLLTLALILTGLYFPAATAQAATEDGLILYYDFDPGDNSRATTVDDKTGNAKHQATLAIDDGAVEGNYAFTDEDIYGTSVKALSLNTQNQAAGPYLKLPDGIFDDCDSATISLWVKLTTDNNGWRCPWSFQRLEDGDTDYYTDTEAFYIWAASWEGDMGYVSMGKNYDSRKSIRMPKVIDTNRWVLTTVVVDGTKMSYYENGKLIGEVDTGMTLKDLGSTNRNFIGNSPYEDGTTTGSFAEFKIYNKALTAEEVGAMFNPSDDAIIATDAEALSLGNTSAVEEPIKLPSKGTYGSDITWESDNAAIAVGALGADGYYATTVTRPASGSGDAKVKLTATVSYGEGTPVKKEIQATVPERYSDQQIVDLDKESVIKAVGTLGNVFAETLSLPATAEQGSTVTWAWDGPEGAIAIPAQAVDGTYTAKVTRPALGSADAEGKLKGTVTSGDKSAVVEIDVKVMAFRGSAAIVEKIELIEVTTLVGHSPTLPNYLSVTYSDGSSGKLKLTWPNAIDAASYAAAGTFEVMGQAEGLENAVIAKVTVIEGDETAKQIVSGNFDLCDISLDKIGENGSILTQNRERDIVYLKLLDNKRMLYNFYNTFGQTDKIQNVSPLGGWDAPTGLLRGHSTGHYMSALALAYGSTGDAEIKQKLDEMVHELRELQKLSKGEAKDFQTKGVLTSTWSKDPNVWGEGFVSAYSPDQFALLEQGVPYGSPDSGIWAPYYTLHKLLAGFLDAYKYTGNEEALEAAKGVGSWACNRLGACDQALLTKMWATYIAGEFGGFNESLAQLYIYTGEQKYLDGAKLFDNTAFFDGLAANVDTIQGKHANQHIPQIIGAIKMYEASVKAGKPEVKYYNVAENFWRMVNSRYAYSIGGVGTGEKFQQPYKQAANISGNENCETCAAYNLMKLTMLLNNYNPDDAEYMDYYERTLYNQIVASQTPNVDDGTHNGTTYMLPIGPGARRSYGGDYNSFSCCHGTGMENHVKYQEAAYAKTDSDLYVGLYLPSTVTWTEKGVKVVQETQFPSENTKLTVSQLEGKKASAFNMKLRVPYWATKGFTVKVNGKVQNLNAKASSYVTLKNVKAGDVIDVTMPWSVHLDKTPDKRDNMEIASVMYGPFVMPIRNSSRNWLTLNLPGNLDGYFTVGTNEDGYPTLAADGYNFLPMFAKEYASEGYHAYVKVSVAQESGVLWDKTKLNAAISLAESAKQSDYTAANWSKLQSALTAAKEVSANVAADQTAIDQALNDLNQAINATIPPKPTKPGKPGSVTAVWAGNSSKNVKVAWKSAANATKYYVYRSDKAKSGFTKIGEVKTKAGVKSYTYTDKKATAGKKVYYKIAAYNGSVKGADSSVVNTCILKKPGAPKASVKKAGKKKNVTVSFKKVANASGYEIWRATKKKGSYKKVASLNAKTVKKVFKNVKKGTYYYKVRAYLKNGKSKKIYTSYSAVKQVKVK